MEIIVTKDGPKIVELGARLGGDCITSHLVYLSTGIDMVKETIKVLCGEEPDLTQKYEKGASIRFLTSDESGSFKYVEGEDSARHMDGIIEISDIMQTGDLIESVRSSDDRVAYVIAQGKDVAISSNIAEAACSKMKVMIERGA